MPKSEVPSARPDVDLRTFNADSALDEIIIGAASPDARKDPRAYARKALIELPLNAKWPVVEVIFARDEEARGNAAMAKTYGTPFEQSPHEVEIIDYTKYLLGFEPNVTLSPEEQTLREDISKSSTNNRFFKDYEKLTVRAQRGAEFLTVYNTEWARVQEESQEKSERKPATITGQWSRLRNQLDYERRFEERARDFANRRVPYVENLHVDPRIAGSNHLMAKSQQYEFFMRTHADDKAGSLQMLRDEVTAINSNDPIQTAKVLWDEFLNEDEKEAISRNRQTFTAAVDHIFNGIKFTSHTDLDFQAYMNGMEQWKLNDPRRRWFESIIAIERITEPVQKILIGDLTKVPLSTRDALQDRSTEGPQEIENAFRFQKSNPLERYVLDVSLAFLYDKHFANNAAAK